MATIFQTSDWEELSMIGITINSKFTINGGDSKFTINGALHCLIFRLLMGWVFDGHVWNMKLLDPDVFTSFSLASLTELPAAVLLAIFLDRWGRRWMGFVSMFLCGTFSFIALATPAGEFLFFFFDEWAFHWNCSIISEFTEEMPEVLVLHANSVCKHFKLFKNCSHVVFLYGFLLTMSHLIMQ